MAKPKQIQETVAAPPPPAAPAPSKATPLPEWWAGIRVKGPAKYDVVVCGVDGVEKVLETDVDIAVARQRFLLHSQRRIFHPNDL